MKSALAISSGYPERLQELKRRIRAAQVRAAFVVGRELVILYWSYEREGKSLTNFHLALPSPDSDLAEKILKDPCSNAPQILLAALAPTRHSPPVSKSKAVAAPHSPSQAAASARSAKPSTFHRASD